MKNNLVDFPTVNCITMQSSAQRQQIILNQCNQYQLNCNFFHGYSALNNTIPELINNLNVSGSWLEQLTPSELCISLSHLKCIYKWYTETNEPYGFFCEDDIDFSLNKFWNFTWLKLIQHLPPNWGCIQLTLLKDFTVNCIEDSIKLHLYKWDNWSACAYIMSRPYAEKLISYHITETGFNLNLPYYPESIPYSENIIFNADGKQTTYTFPVFTEQLDSITSRSDQFDNGNNTISFFTRMWWEMIGKFKPIEYFFN